MVTFHVAAVHMSGGTQHQHIKSVIYVNDHYLGGECSTATVIAHLRAHPGTVTVTDGQTTATVEVVNASPPYIRSVADGKTSDNLLKIQRY